MSQARAVVDAVANDAPPRNPYTKRFAYDGNGNLQYVGWAQADGNPLVTEAKWAVQKFTYNANSPPQWVLSQWAKGAGGCGSEDNVWNDRASLTYQ